MLFTWYHDGLSDGDLRKSKVVFFSFRGYLSASSAAKKGDLQPLQDDSCCVWQSEHAGVRLSSPSGDGG